MSRFKYNIFIAIVVLFCLGSGIYIYKTHYTHEEVEESTEIKLWYVESDELHKGFEKIADTYNNNVDDENTKSVSVSVKAFESFDKLKAELENPDSDESPDMIACDANDAAILKNDSVTIKLSGYFDEWNASNANKQLLKGATLGNTLIGLPYAAAVELMLVNTDCVTDADSIKSIEDLCAAANEYYKENEKSMFSIDDYARFFRTAMAQLGENFVAVSPRDTDSENCKYIYKLLAQTAFDRGAISSYDPIGDVIDGTIACAIVSSSEIMERASELGKNIKVFTCPVMENGKNISVPSIETICVCKTDTNRQNASVEFLKWFISDDVNCKFVSGSGYIPVTDTLGSTNSKQPVYNSLKMALSSVELKAGAPNLAYIENYDEFMYVMQLVMDSLS